MHRLEHVTSPHGPSSTHPHAAWLSLLLVRLPVAGETPPPLEGGRPPSRFAELWVGFDPQAEPLETEILRQWKQDGTVLRVVRLRIDIYKGVTARLAAVYGFPKSAVGGKVPELLQIHGGGQYTDFRARLAEAARPWATT